MRLLTLQNAKTPKGERLGWITGILYLAPAKTSGTETCPWRSKGCTAACLFTAGRGAMRNVRDGRLRKTKLLQERPRDFFALLRNDVEALVRKAKREGKRAAIRLNGTSDVVWEEYTEFWDLTRDFPEVRWYDYTKAPHSERPTDLLPANYDLTYSRKETDTVADVRREIAEGRRVAVVFRDELPETWQGVPVVNGDETDLRFLDPPGVIVGLVAKGRAKRDETGFVLEQGETVA